MTIKEILLSNVQDLFYVRPSLRRRERKDSWMKQYYVNSNHPHPAEKISAARRLVAYAANKLLSFRKTRRRCEQFDSMLFQQFYNEARITSEMELEQILLQFIIWMRSKGFMLVHDSDLLTAQLSRLFGISELNQ